MWECRKLKQGSLSQLNFKHQIKVNLALADIQYEQYGIKTCTLREHMQTTIKLSSNIIWVNVRMRFMKLNIPVMLEVLPLQKINLSNEE